MKKKINAVFNIQHFETISEEGQSGLKTKLMYQQKLNYCRFVKKYRNSLFYGNYQIGQRWKFLVMPLVKKRARYGPLGFMLLKKIIHLRLWLK